MFQYVSKETIKMMREKNGYTQKQLAEQLSLSDKTISKWETGRGLPDISLLEPLASALHLSVSELLSGQCLQNGNRSGNVLRSCFYVCPLCGNVIFSMGEGCYSCCGITLPPLEAESQDLETHPIQVEMIEDEYFITVDHPMQRNHYLSFFAYQTTDRMQLVKLYPQQQPQARVQISGSGRLYVYCNQHGLFMRNIP